MVSFDGTKKIHNKYRPFINGKGSFDVIKKNIYKMSRYLPLQGRGTVVKDAVNKKTIIKTIKLAESLGIINLVLSPVDCSKIEPIDVSLNKMEMKKLSLIYEEITETNFINIRKGLKHRIIFDAYSSFIKRFFEGTLDKYRYCGACFGMATICTNGDIYPCHRFVGMKNYIIGNVFSGRDNNKILCFF